MSQRRVFKPGFRDLWDPVGLIGPWVLRWLGDLWPPRLFRGRKVGVVVVLTAAIDIVGKLDLFFLFFFFFVPCRRRLGFSLFFQSN